MLLLLAILFAPTSALNLICHCLNDTQCHANGYCDHGCANGWFGPGCQIGNIALGKAAEQSSTYFDAGISYVYSAGLAVDGRMPDIEARYCSHTHPQYGTGSAWWSVVLDTLQYFVITNITIVNRKFDGGRSHERLTNFKILYSNDTQATPNPSDSIWHECVEEKDTIGSRKSYTCKNMAIAKRVAVYLTRDESKNLYTILTLCEVEIYGYRQYICPSGYTGPGCLLRTCDQCDINIGRCLRDNGSCSYNVCPRRSLLPPECWITLSDYTEVAIRADATCNKLLYSVDLPDTQPNIAASLLQLQVSTSDGQVLVNTTIPVRGLKSTTYNYSYATTDTSYEVSVKPVYCGILNVSCDYASSSKTFKVSTGKREYVLSHNSSCVFVAVKSGTHGCESPTEFKVTCQSDIINGGAVNSSSSSICGLKRGQGYNCSLAAIFHANVTERANARVIIGDSKAQHFLHWQPRKTKTLLLIYREALEARHSCLRHAKNNMKALMNRLIWNRDCKQQELTLV